MGFLQACDIDDCLKCLQQMSNRGGVMIPIASQPVQPSPQNIQIKSMTNLSKPTIHIKQEGGKQNAFCLADFQVSISLEIPLTYVFTASFPFG